jgi:cytochrome b
MNSVISIMLVNSAIAFVMAFGMILFIAVVARYIAGVFASDAASRIAGFCVAIGYALGHFSDASAATMQELPSLGAPIGAIAGVIATWAWLIRKGANAPTDADA